MTRSALSTARGTKQSNYKVFTPVLVEDFSGAPSNDPHSAYIQETTINKTGTASAGLSSPSSPSLMDFVFTPTKITESGIGVWFYKPEGATWTSINFFISSSGGAFSANTWANVAMTADDGVKTTAGADQRTGWNFKILYPSDFSPNGSFDISTALIDTVRVRHDNAGVGDVIIDSINFNVRARAKCLVMADDTHESFWTLGKPILDAAGFPVTIYQTHDLIDSANYATTAQLTSAYNAGWDICNHLDEHVQLTNIVTGITKATQAVIAVSTSHSSKINIGDEMTLSDVEGMTEINGTHTVTAIPDNTHVTLDIDSTGFTTYTANGKLRYSAAQLKIKLDVMDSWLASHGMGRSRKHFAYPTGIFDVEFHPSFMEGYGFKTARAIHSTLINHHVLGVDNMHHLWAKGVGVSVTALNITDKIDQAIKNGDTFCLYLHGLTTGVPAEDTYFWLESKFQTVIDYLKIKSDNGEIDVTTISKWNNGL